MPALPPYLIEPIWEQLVVLLPKRQRNHPLGCHRPRIPDRIVFEKLVQVLVFGCAYEKIADEGCSATTIRRRRDEWIVAGVLDALREIALEAYDRMVGLEPSELAVDSCITKAPCGGQKAGRSPVDRGKQGIKRSVVVDGAEAGAADHSHHPVRATELFDARTETWTTLAPINRNRMYHSTAILLRSGRVLVAGNTEHWNPSNPVEDKTVEIFTPPYLQRGPRPRVAEAPPQLAYGQPFSILSPDVGRIRSVALMRAGSVTHTNNMDQRYVGLTIEGRVADRLTIRAPQDGTYAPPGHYLLFIVDDDRVPSVASMVRLNPLAPPVGKTLAVDRWIPVRESDADVDTGIDVGPGDEYAFVEANGSIWAGVWGTTGRNGPQGWDNIDHDPKFPLHEGAYAHPFSLVGKFAGLPYFYIGTGRLRERYPDTQVRRLYLRINDDVPGNGNGQFSCRVQLWSNRPLGYQSLQSLNYPTRFVRHALSLGELTEIHTDLDRRDATFKIVPGLADGQGISLEASNYPGHYLRHQGYQIKLHRHTEDQLFKEDATFFVVPGLANSSWSSLRSCNFPDRYMRHRDFHLWVESGTGDLFRNDATFKIVDPFRQP